MVGYRDKVPNRKLDLRMHARLRMTKNKFYSITNDINNFYEHMLDFRKGYADDLDIIVMWRFLDTSMYDVFRCIFISLLLRRIYLRLSRSRLLVWAACIHVFKREEFKFTIIRSRWVPITMVYLTYTNSYLPLSLNMSTLHIVFYYVTAALLLYTLVLIYHRFQNNYLVGFMYRTLRQDWVCTQSLLKVVLLLSICQ